jgi:hypothetical protein
MTDFAYLMVLSVRQTPHCIAVALSKLYGQVEIRQEQRTGNTMKQTLVISCLFPSLNSTSLHAFFGTGWRFESTVQSLVSQESTFHLGIIVAPILVHSRRILLYGLTQSKLFTEKVVAEPIGGS